MNEFQNPIPNTFLNAGWSITEDDTLLKGTPILVNGQWKIRGNSTPPQPEPKPEPKPEPNNGGLIPNSIPPEYTDVQRIVDSIDDSLIVKISSPTKALPNIKIVDGGIKMPDDVEQDEREGEVK